MQTTCELLIELVHSAVTDKLIEKPILSDNECKELYHLAKRHGLLHLVGEALVKNNLFDEKIPVHQAFYKALMKAVVRYEQMHFQFKAICDVFENAKIDFIPLKGAILRDYYPQPWMRQSCDIDILVKVADIDRACEILYKKLDFSVQKHGEYDVSLLSKSGVHFELHFGIMESIFEGSKMLDLVWETVSLAENSKYRYVMSDDLFYFYHIVHMAKHFEANGCGIRFFLDTWVLNHSSSFNLNGLYKSLLDSVGLLKFEEASKLLCTVWFEGSEHTPLTKDMEKFIIDAGLYGTRENHFSFFQIRSGGKKRYALSRIFPPFSKMKKNYPILKKHKYLLPVCHIIRWFHVVIKGRAQASLLELDANFNVSKEHVSFVKSLFERLK